MALATSQALSPWPDTPAAQAAAITRLRAAVAGRAESDEAACALGEMASARVEREAPLAPQNIRDEATIRYAGYMAQADYGPVMSETIGPDTKTYQANHAAAFRLCGAAGLVSPWKIRRAGVIG